MDMNDFSVFNYENLSDSLKADFNKALASKLSSLLTEIKVDDVLGTIGVEGLVPSEGTENNIATIVTELYSEASAGVQAGSGNQNLYLGILNAFTDCWKEIKL